MKWHGVFFGLQATAALAAMPVRNCYECLSCLMMVSLRQDVCGDWFLTGAAFWPLVYVNFLLRDFISTCHPLLQWTVLL
jgi:hypothetical protein